MVCQRQIFPVSVRGRKCDLCLSEKLAISKASKDIAVNKQSKISLKYGHKAKVKLRRSKRLGFSDKSQEKETKDVQLYIF